MTYHYHLGVGTTTTHAHLLPLAMNQLMSLFSVIHQTRRFTGPCDLGQSSCDFVNIGVTIQSELPWADLKKEIKIMERAVEFFPWLDVDIMTQHCNNDVLGHPLLINPKILTHTHCVRLLAELMPTIRINGRSMDDLRHA
jgi:7,8-dihydro-6-hydroxymethylpterin-pyrophosphokinase